MIGHNDPRPIQMRLHDIQSQLVTATRARRSLSRQASTLMSRSTEATEASSPEAAVPFDSNDQLIPVAIPQGYSTISASTKSAPVDAFTQTRDIATASESTSTEAPAEHIAVGVNTEPPMTCDDSSHVSPDLVEPSKEAHLLSGKLGFQRSVKGSQQQSVREKVEWKERDWALKQMRLLKHELCKAQKQNKYGSAEVSALKAALKKRDEQISSILADWAALKKTATGSITRLSEENVLLAGDVESWKAKHAASETKCTDLAAQMDKVAAFDALHEQKMELEALLAAAVVRLERVMNATYQAAKYKDQCVGPANSESKVLHLLETQVACNDTAVQALRKKLDEITSTTRPNEQVGTRFALYIRHDEPATT